MAAIASNQTIGRKTVLRLLRDRSGASAPIIAMVILVLFGFLGLSVDVANWYMQRRAMQSATDAAALSAAHIMYEQQSTTGLSAEMEAAAKNDAKRNGYDDAAGNITVVKNHPYNGDPNKVEVVMTMTEESLIANFITSSGGTTIARRAVAGITASDGNYCMLALSPTCQDTVKINGTADIVLTDCPIMSNSCHSQSANKLLGSSEVWTPSIAACGNYEPGGNIDLHLDPNINNGQVMQGAQPRPDPLSDIPECQNEPTCQQMMSSCNAFPSGQSSQALADANPISAGCYTEMNFSNNAYYTFDSGDYYVQGDFRATSGANGPAGVTGTGVTFHLSPTSQLNIAKGNFNLSAPTTGVYENILFFQSRDASINSCSGTQHTIEGAGTLTGTVYIPNQEVHLNSNGSVGSPGCLRIVSQILELNGTSEIYSDCSGSTGTPETVLLPPKLLE